MIEIGLSYLTSPFLQEKTREYDLDISYHESHCRSGSKRLLHNEEKPVAME